LTSLYRVVIDAERHDTGSSHILTRPSSAAARAPAPGSGAAKGQLLPGGAVITMLDKPVLLTREGLEKLQRELEELRTVRRSEVAERIKYAKEFGDIMENSEYEDAKNEQGMLEGRILTLEKMVRNAVIIEEHHDGIVQVGSRVRVKDEYGEEEFTIVGPAEVDVAGGRISMESPVGKALMGHKVGEKVSVQTPSGTRPMTILRVD
jgi:transcription elongation factor GreA